MGGRWLWDFVQPCFRYIRSIYIVWFSTSIKTYIEFVTIVCSAFQGLHCNEDILVAFPTLPHANTTPCNLRLALKLCRWTLVWGHLGLHNPFASATSKYSMSPVKPRAQGNQIKMVFKLWCFAGEKSNHGDLWPVEADQFCNGYLYGA